MSTNVKCRPKVPKSSASTKGSKIELFSTFSLIFGLEFESRSCSLPSFSPLLGPFNLPAKFLFEIIDFVEVLSLTCLTVLIVISKSTKESA